VSLHVVTGGSGFVGGPLVEHLVDRGEDVRVLDVADPDLDAKTEQSIEYQEVDVRDPDSVRAGVAGADYVHHTVALVPLTKAGDTFWEVNVDGTEHVMQVALEEDVDGVTHVSSSAVHDLSSMPVTEDTPTDPIGCYGESKLAGDRVVLDYAKQGLPANVMRPRTVLDARRAGIYHILFDGVHHDERVFMLGDVTNEFQLISGQDLARACRLAAESRHVGEVYSVGNAEYGTLDDDFTHLVDYANGDSSITYVPAALVRWPLRVLDRIRLSPLAPWHYETVDKDYWFDITKTRK
jgi:nucleoside-diphosphate-sugar epimerase